MRAREAVEGKVGLEQGEAVERKVRLEQGAERSILDAEALEAGEEQSALSSTAACSMRAQLLYALSPLLLLYGSRAALSPLCL